MRYYRSFAVLLVLWFAGTREIAGAGRPRTSNQTRLRDSIAAGDHHSCQVMGDGTVRCWGLNDTFQLGVDNSSTSGTFRSTAVTVPGIFGAVAVAAGSSHTCALLNIGTVRCWGKNTIGQLGDATTTTRSMPADVLVGDPAQPSTLAPLSNVKAITAGFTYSCALLADSSVRCWGSNGHGSLGTSPGGANAAVVAVPVSGITNAVAIGAGGSHTCAVLSNGTVKCWGSNLLGEIGDGTVGTDRLTPVPVGGLAGPAVAIAASVVNTCALLANGTAECWGGNAFGQVANGTTQTSVSLPSLVLSKSGNGFVQLNNITDIAAGFDYACALVANGTVGCWGLNTFGQVGDGSTINRHTADLQPYLSTVVSIATGGAHACAVLADGTTRCWGKNMSDDGNMDHSGPIAGQLGNGDAAFSVSFSSTPVFVTGSGGSFTAAAIAAGSQHTCAIRTNGSVACWGHNSTGQLGNGTGTDSTAPVAVEKVSNAVAITAGEFHSCAVLADGTVRCWGADFYGQSGVPLGMDQRTAVTVGVSNAINITAGDSHTCALLADGTARCWGDGIDGDLGNGQVSISPDPVAVNGVDNAVALAAGSACTCAVRADGIAKCWGKNTHGQLGDGSQNPAIIEPVVVSVPDTSSAQQPPPRTPLLDITAIATHSFHTCAIIANGLAKCWGSNSNGQIGDGTSGSGNDRLSPTAVRDPGNRALSNVTAIAAGAGHSCARTGGGEVRCWGANLNGELGDGSTTDRSFPAYVMKSVYNRITQTFQYVPQTGLVQIAAGDEHSCALQPNGGPLCWGANQKGQIGDGTQTDRLIPVAVGSFTLNIDPTVSLSNRRVLTVNIVATCTAGSRLHVSVAVAEGSASGTGVGEGLCTGQLEKYPVNLPAQGVDGFASGAALIQAGAYIRDTGVITDTQQWTRKVNIVP